MAKLFLVFVTIAVPVLYLVYALFKRSVIPFILGVLAFVLSQVIIRIPILTYLSSENSTYQLLSATKPILMLFFLAFSAGIVEECARWIFMRYLMKKKTNQHGIIFGMGHGGIEALLIVGIPLIGSLVLTVQPQLLVLTGIERICAMAIHICLSVWIVIGVREKNILFCIYTISIHTFINFATGFLAKTQSPIVVESVLVVLTGLLILFTFNMIRRKKNDEKMDERSV